MLCIPHKIQPATIPITVQNIIIIIINPRINCPVAVDSGPVDHTHKAKVQATLFTLVAGRTLQRQQQELKQPPLEAFRA